jgi:hypothetical protein
MSQGKFRKGKITAWLLPIALVLSLFALSVSGTPSTTRRAIVTEQVLPTRIASKQNLSFRVNSDAYSLSFQYPAVVCFQEAVRYYSHAIKIQISQRAHHPPAFAKFMLPPSQHTLRSSDEDHILSIVG